MARLLSDLEIPYNKHDSIVLTGHNESLTTKKRMSRLGSVHYNDWIENCLSTNDGRKQSNVIHIAYSLGATALLNSYLKDPSSIPDKLILFAPAISVHSWTNGWKIFSLFPKFPVPSFQPKVSRSNYYIPINAYKQLFKLKSMLKKDLKKLSDIQTLIFINNNDELVSAKGLNQLLTQCALNNWKLIRLDGKQVKLGKRHIIIDKNYLPQKDWMLIKETIQMFVEY